jgi:hypothetical protein
MDAVTSPISINLVRNICGWDRSRFDQSHQAKPVETGVPMSANHIISIF